jgi:PilZ domain
LAEVKSLKVAFPTARDLLNAYWGLLANGGLVLPSPPYGLQQGDRVALEVTIESAAMTCALDGQIVRHPGTASGLSDDRIVIAFEPGEPQDVLLDAAWAEIDNVPARRERRFALDVDIHFAPADDTGGAALSARLVNLSLGGCCLRVPRSNDGPKVRVGEPLKLISPNSQVVGVVKWSDGSCRGIEFQTPATDDVESFVRQFII